MGIFDIFINQKKLEKNLSKKIQKDMQKQFNKQLKEQQRFMEKEQRRIQEEQERQAQELERQIASSFEVDEETAIRVEAKIYEQKQIVKQSAIEAVLRQTKDLPELSLEQVATIIRETMNDIDKIYDEGRESIFDLIQEGGLE